MSLLAPWTIELLTGLVAWAADPVPEAEDVRPGWIALTVVALLVAASVLLWFSMRKQLGRIRLPEDEDAEEEAAEERPPGPPAP